MKMMAWIAVGAIAVAIGVWFYGRYRRLRQSRMISLVALLREPIVFDPAVLAKIASQAWNADLGDGTTEGADGFVVGDSRFTSIMSRGRMYLVNCLPDPYVEDPVAASESISDLRIRALFSEHRAWFSCDCLGVDGTATEEQIAESYRCLAKLFVELLDENCLLIYLPDSGVVYPINEETERALQSADPLKSLRETMTVPVIEVSDDDPLMIEAIANARRGWPQFVAAFEARAGENFSIKAPVRHAGNTEFIWICVTAIEGDRVYGTLGNDPANLGALKLNSKVSVPVDELNDWCYFESAGNLAGGFTIAAVQEAARRPRKQ